MKRPYYFIIPALLLSCSEVYKPDKSELKNTETPIIITAKQENLNDSVLYINKIDYFSTTKEFYVALDFSKPSDYTFFESLSKKADSTIFENDEVYRGKLPLKIAKDAFDLRQLEKLKIYNSEHQFITNAKFKRVEYYSDLNSYFIAVFAPENKILNKNESFYCLGAENINLQSIQNQIIESDELTQTIENELNIKPDYIWKIKHVKVEPGNSVFSIYACHEVNGGTVTYLTKFKHNKVTLLHTLKEDVAFYDLLPLPIIRNGKPVLLLQLVLPDSDAVDEFLVATFDGSKYNLESRNRITL